MTTGFYENNTKLRKLKWKNNSAKCIKMGPRIWKID